MASRAAAGRLLFRSCCRPQASRRALLSPAAAHAPPPAAPQAALLVIGNEILTGGVADANTPWLAKALYARGVDLVRVEVVPDDEADIAASVLRLRERVGDGGAVFTSGGIGPTHDDVSYQAIASALGTTLELHAPTAERMREHYTARGVELNEARLRMARLPAGAEVLITPGLWVPLVALRSVYVLPGIPRLFRAMLGAHLGRFRGPQAHSAALWTNLGEGDLAVPLAAVAAAHPAVRIGSYPCTGPLVAGGGPGAAGFRVKLQLESRDPEALQAALGATRDALPTFDLAEAAVEVPTGG